MSMREEVVTKILEASGGKIVGRIRLQKMIYLFQELGSGSDFKFSYYHYGPYSEEVSIAVQRAIFADKAIAEKDQTSSYGVKYSEFELLKPTNPNSLGKLAFGDACRLTEIMKSETSVVIELAATIHWLKYKELVSDWENELRLRKPAKASADNVSRAQSLLNNINLAA